MSTWNHQQLNCSFNIFCRITIKETSTLYISGLLWGELPVTDGFLSQNDNIIMWKTFACHVTVMLQDDFMIYQLSVSASVDYMKTLVPEAGISAWKNNYILQYSVGYSCLPMHEIPASGTNILKWGLAFNSIGPVDAIIFQWYFNILIKDLMSALDNSSPNNEDFVSTKI